MRKTISTRLFFQTPVPLTTRTDTEYIFNDMPNSRYFYYYDLIANEHFESFLSQANTVY